MNKVNVPQLRFSGFDGEWEFKTLSEVSSKITDGTHDTPKPIKKGIPFLTAIHIKDGFVDYNNCYYLDEEVHNSIYKRCNPEKDDLLIVNIGAGTATCAINTVDYEFSLKNVALVKPHKALVNGKFLAQIQRKKSSKIFNQLTSGGAQPFLSLKEIGRLQISFPSLPEQQKIASFLSAVDEKIQQLSRKKQLLEQYKKGVMQQLFSGKLRFKDENGKDYADWEEKKLGEVCSNISYGMNAAATAYDGQNKYLRITDIDETSNGLNLDKLTSPDGKLEDKFRVKEGDLLFARTGASVGKSYLYRKTDGILYFAGFLIRFNVKKAIPAFVYLQTQSSKYDKWVKIMSMRSGQPGINAEEYKTFEILFPCLEEQQKIANFLSNIDIKIENTNQEINKMQNFKKGLLQKMFV